MLSACAVLTCPALCADGMALPSSAPVDNPARVESERAIVQGYRAMRGLSDVRGVSAPR